MREQKNGLFAEPLLHFLLIGATLFAVSWAMTPEAENPRTIRVDAGVHAHLANLFKESDGRLPTSQEMDRMVDLFIKNETLYREARVLNLDEGDEMMRERLAQRMRLMLYSGIAIEAPSDEVLRPWVAERVEDYAVPAKMSLRLIGLDAEEARAREIAQLARDRDDAGNPVQSNEFYMVKFPDRPRDQLVRLFGEEFISAIEELPENRWTAVSSPRGWQVARFEGIRPAEPAVFEDIASEARAHWQEAQKQAEARAALDALMQTYTIERVPYGDGVVDDNVQPSAASLTQ